MANLGVVFPYSEKDMGSYVYIALPIKKFLIFFIDH